MLINSFKAARNKIPGKYLRNVQTNNKLYLVQKMSHKYTNKG